MKEWNYNMIWSQNSQFYIIPHFKIYIFQLSYAIFYFWDIDIWGFVACKTESSK